MKYTRLSKTIDNCCGVCVAVLIVAVFVLSAIVGLKQNLTCYVIDSNYKSSISADEIHSYEESGAVSSSGLNIFYAVSPVGCGDYISVFDEGEIWVVRELTVRDSISITMWFSLLNTATYVMVLLLIYRYSIRSKTLLWLVIGYGSLAVVASSIVYEYSSYVLYRVSGVGLLLLVLRMFIMMFVTVKSRNIVHIKTKIMK